MPKFSLSPVYILIRFWYNISYREQKGGLIMAKTTVRNNESLDDALRRFKREVSKVGTLAEVRKREHYVKPSIKRKLKSEAARKNGKRR